MLAETFNLEIITPAFCGGARPQKQAELRPASIRGQLRWWFRVLGGFKSLAPVPVSSQEAEIFGSIAGGGGRAGKLVVRIAGGKITAAVKDGQDLGHPNFSPSAYLTFPVQSREIGGRKAQSAGRGVLLNASFKLVLLWRGPSSRWKDLRALVTVFGHLGALGFRSRRAMGSLAFSNQPPLPLAAALAHFANPESILIKALPAQDAKDAISVLGGWLKSCRAHGRSGQNEQEQKSPYFEFARQDHDIGYRKAGTENLPAMRPALGLPIIQRIHNGQNTWEWYADPSRKKGKGRFASPVILRPHRDAKGNWRALVIFVEARKWPTGKMALLDDQPRKVSLDLYEAMKRDPKLQPFSG